MTTSAFSARSSARALWTSAGRSQRARPPRRGSGSAWPCSRPDAPCAPGRPFSRMASTRPGKPAPGAEVDPGAAPPAPAAAAGRCRRRGAARTRRALAAPTRFMPLVPVGQHARESCSRSAICAGARAGRAPAKLRRVERRRGGAQAARARRTWASRAVSAPGVTPSMRDGLAERARAHGGELLARLVREAADRRRSRGRRAASSALVAAEGLDVGVLAVEVAGVGGVDLDLLARPRPASRRSPARAAARSSKPMLG